MNMDLARWTGTLSEMTFRLKLCGDFWVPQGRDGARTEPLLLLRNAPEPSRGSGEGPGPGPSFSAGAAGIPAPVPPMPPLPANVTPYGDAGKRAWALYQDLRT